MNKRKNTSSKKSLTDTKLCTKCKTFLFCEFDFYKNSRTSDGYSTICKECCKSSRSRATNKDHARDIQRKYNLSPDDYDKLRASQNYRCKICGLHENKNLHKKLHIDHDHSTGMIRGLLCNSCNRGIGLLQDDYVLLYAAARYVQRHLENSRLSTPSESR